MESTLPANLVASPALVAPRSKKIVIAYWVTSVFFGLWMLFTAYWELWAPQAADVFTQLGFPDHFFRVELSLAKVAGVAILLSPAPPRLKEWAYAGFAINLGSAVIAHLVTGVGAWIPALSGGAVLAVQYVLNRRQARKD